MTQQLHDKLLAWASQHSNVTPLDGTDRDSPTFGDLRALLSENAGLRHDLERWIKIANNETDELTRNTAIADQLAEALERARFVMIEFDKYCEDGPEIRKIDQALATYRESGNG